MSTYLLLWNPTNPDTWASYERDRRKTKSGKAVRGGWSTGNTKTMPVGSRVFMVRQYKDRGIIAAGQTTGSVYRDTHWEDQDRDANYVSARFDVILSPEQVLPIDVLQEKISSVYWSWLPASGTRVQDDDAKRLEALWETHVYQLGVPTKKTRIARRMLAEEVYGRAAKYPEGAVTRVLVNAYERNEQAREACIDEFGATCAVCGFEFGAIYGDLGTGFIHVHHLKNLASIAKSYEVDPIKDLRPVCPNCHCMLHRRDPALTIGELKTIVAIVRRAVSRKVPR